MPIKIKPLLGPFNYTIPGVKKVVADGMVIYQPQPITRQMFIKTIGFKKPPYTANQNPLIFINDFEHYYQDVPNLTEFNNVYGVQYHDKPSTSGDLTIKYNGTTVMAWGTASSIPNFIDLTQWIDFSSNLNWYFNRTVTGNAFTGFHIVLDIYNIDQYTAVYPTIYQLETNPMSNIIIEINGKYIRYNSSSSYGAILTTDISQAANFTLTGNSANSCISIQDSDGRTLRANDYQMYLGSSTSWDYRWQELRDPAQTTYSRMSIFSGTAGRYNYVAADQSDSTKVSMTDQQSAAADGTVRWLKKNY